MAGRAEAAAKRTAQQGSANRYAQCRDQLPLDADARFALAFGSHPLARTSADAAYAEFAANLIGRHNAKWGARRLFAAVQSKRLNKVCLQHRVADYVPS